MGPCLLLQGALRETSGLSPVPMTPGFGETALVYPPVTRHFLFKEALIPFNLG